MTYSDSAWLSLLLIGHLTHRETEVFICVYTGYACAHTEREAHELLLLLV